MNAINSLLYVINDKSDVIDVDAFRFKFLSATHLAETKIEAVRSSDYAPPLAATIALLLDLKSKKRGIERR